MPELPDEPDVPDEPDEPDIPVDLPENRQTFDRDPCSSPLTTLLSKNLVPIVTYVVLSVIDVISNSQRL